MNNLPDLLNFVVSSLQASSLCHSVSVLETHQFSERQFALKVRAEFVRGGILQVRLYCNGEHTDYAYQFVRDEKSILRWDNKEHFLSLSSHPNHFHSASGQVEASTLTGDPTRDLPSVLNYLATFSK